MDTILSGTQGRWCISLRGSERQRKAPLAMGTRTGSRQDTHVCMCVHACVHVCARMCAHVGTAPRYTPIVWTCVHKCSYARAHVHSHLDCHLELLWLVRAWPDRERGQPGSPSALPLILYVALGASVPLYKAPPATPRGRSQRSHRIHGRPGAERAPHGTSGGHLADLPVRDLRNVYLVSRGDVGDHDHFLQV